jgi:hypothetical protein
MTQQPLFEGLVYDEMGNLVETAIIGGDAHYVIDDNGFRRHIIADTVDRQVIAFFLQQLEDNRDLAVEQTLTMIGKDDIFTKAAIETELRNIDMDKIIAQGIPQQARQMLGMMGFRIVIDFHGELVKLEQPTLPDEDN